MGFGFPRKSYMSSTYYFGRWWISRSHIFSSELVSIETPQLETNNRWDWWKCFTWKSSQSVRWMMKQQGWIYWVVAIQIFLIFIPIFGEMIQFDLRIFFRWVETANQFTFKRETQMSLRILEMSLGSGKNPPVLRGPFSGVVTNGGSGVVSIVSGVRILMVEKVFASSKNKSALTYFNSYTYDLHDFCFFGLNK